MANSNNNPVLTTNTDFCILYVDDEVKELKYFKKAFNREFKIKTAENVENAINVLDQKDQNIAVVITDHRMPKRHGIDLLEYTKVNYPNIIRMLTTAYCDMSNSIDAINQAEVFRYVPKPWDINELSGHLNNAINKFILNESSARHSELKLSTPQDILDLVNQDCQRWLEYSMHAYGDVEIYKGGIEAIVYKHQSRIENQLKRNENQLLSEAINQLMDKHFLSDPILQNIHSQSDMSFTSSHALKNASH